MATELDTRMVPRILRSLRRFAVQTFLIQERGLVNPLTSAPADGALGEPTTTSIMATPTSQVTNLMVFPSWVAGDAEIYVNGTVEDLRINDRISQHDENWRIVEIVSFRTGDLIAAYALRLQR